MTGYRQPGGGSAGLATFELLLILIAAALTLAAFADRLRIPQAVALVCGGMALAFVPGIGRLQLEPELALALFLPPLLQASAYRTDWPAFRFNLRPILLLAVGLVFFTAAAVAVVAKMMVPALPWWAAVALGAIVAPPDAVAAAAVLKQVKLPRRIVTVLEGESLINDASSLVLYRLAVTATLAGTFSVGAGMLQFVLSAVGGLVAGWLVARIAMLVFRVLEDTLFDITAGLLAGFIAYFAAEQVHASGVLAAVACGLVLGRQQHAEFTGESRLAQAAVWRFVEFILTAVIFMLIGLQLRDIVARLQGRDAGELALLGAAVAATLIVSRFVWIFPASWLPRRLFPKLAERDPMPPVAHMTVLSWAGMRGVVSLAAALALPTAFPQRDIIVFVAFCAIFVTLVLQGTTLRPLIGWLGIKADEDPGPALAEARASLAGAALGAVRDHADTQGAGGEVDAAKELVEELSTHAARVGADAEDPDTEHFAAQQRLRLVAIEAARDRLNEQTDEIDPEAHRTLAEELDLHEQQVRRALGEGGI